MFLLFKFARAGEWTRDLSVFRLFISSFTTELQCKELLMKGKAQYGWPPHKDRFFCKKGKIIFKYEKQLI